MKCEINNILIEKTKAFLKRKFDESKYLSGHPEEKAYRLEHSYRVANIGKAIAEKEDFSVTEMIIACLLHDVSYCEEFCGKEGWLNHGRNAAKIARPFLKELGLPEDRINDICYGIAIHVDDKADFDGERTPFALTVGDADNLDRFDVYRIYETLHKNNFKDMDISLKKDYVKKRLNELYKLLNMELGTKSAQELWKERLVFYIEFYEKLKEQLKISDDVF